MSRSSLKAQPKQKRQTLRQLQDLQRLTTKIVMRPLGRGMRTERTWIDGRSTADVAATFVKPNDRLTSLERVEIYNRQYWFRLIDCLYDDYPGLLAVVGQTKFDRLIRAYLEQYPSRSFTLRNLGDRLERFIIERPDLLGHKQELAREMAAFEWAQVVAFDGPEFPPLTVDDLLGQNPAKLRLAIQPHITLLEFNWPLDDYALALKRQQAALRGEASNAVDAPPQANSIHRVRLPRREKIFVAVHRHDYDLYYKRLDPAAYRLLASLREGKTLAGACDAAITEENSAGDWASQIQAWFQNWTELGWFH
jgi:hypothetical protein